MRWHPSTWFFIATALFGVAAVAFVIEPTTLAMPEPGDIIQISDQVYLVERYSLLIPYDNPTVSFKDCNIPRSDLRLDWYRSRVTNSLDGYDRVWRGFKVSRDEWLRVTSACTKLFPRQKIKR